MESGDRFLEAVAADLPHGVERAAVVAGAQAVNRHHAGCSNPRVISASATYRWRLSGSLAWSSRICSSTTSRCSSASRATKTPPSPPRALGRSLRNRGPSLVVELRRPDHRRRAHCDRPWDGQTPLPPAAGSIRGRMSATAIRPTSTPSTTTGTDCPALKTRGLLGDERMTWAPG